MVFIIPDNLKTHVSGENGEMYLFQWLSSLEKQIMDATPVCMLVGPIVYTTLNLVPRNT